ncbi:MAG TPA: hypothetical protein VFO85_20255, partial [Vicinamibacteria bacterium]|nr:hypothetical protein [Vicinamibacteria bacterium]
CALVAWDARGFAGFFYHPRMVAVVHLVTLGWISGSILGSFYIVGPLALRLTLPAGRADYLAFAGFAGGVAGLFGHLWTASHAGMAWAAALVAASMALVAGRALRALAASPLPWNARLPVTLAFANLLAAALLGALLGVNKTRPFLPASHLDLVFAHAHLAAVGWAMLMVFGVGYRLLPMVLPAAMPGGPWTYASTVLLQCGLLGIVAAFFREGRGLLPAAALTVAGIAAFFTRVAWMLRHRRPAPRELRRPDWAVAHAMAAFLGLIGASVLGLWLAAVEPSELSMRLVPAYATLGLIGFLSQIVVGMEGRLFPLFAWLWGFADSGHAVLPPSLHQAPPRPLQALGFLLWVAGVPLLAAGLAREADLATAVGAGALCAAAVGNTVVVALVLRRLWRQLPMEEGRSRPN